VQAYSPPAPHVTVGVRNVGLKSSESLPSLTRYVSEFPANGEVWMKLIPILLIPILCEVAYNREIAFMVRL